MTSKGQTIYDSMNQDVETRGNIFSTLGIWDDLLETIMVNLITLEPLTVLTQHLV